MSAELDLSVAQVVAARRQLAAARQAIEGGNRLAAHDALSMADLFLAGQADPTEAEDETA